MAIYAHYDREVDIAWFRFAGYDGSTVISEEVDFGLRDLDPRTGTLVGLEYWKASERLPAELLQALPSPSVGVAK